jgi:hypothetical protein
MDMKGTGVAPTGIFVRETFGDDGFAHWLDSLSAEARDVYSSPVLAGSWYSVKQIVSEPVRGMCGLFYSGDLKGSWDCGRFTAEYGLKGIYEMFVQGGSPEQLIKHGEIVMAAYYRPTPGIHIESSKGSGVLSLTDFPDLDDVMELHVGGWIERALELSGCKDVKVRIARSLARGDTLTEYQANWK